MSFYEEFLKRQEQRKRYELYEKKMNYYRGLMSSPSYGGKSNEPDDYNGGDYEPEDSFSWNYYFNDDGE